MTDLKIYQIGLGSFGRYGFEKLVEMHNHLEQADIELCGVADRDFDRLEAAEKFASRNGIELETFQTSRELYEAAEQEEGDIMIYGAGPSEVHADHIHRSLENGFYHLTEKPPSMTRDEHIREKELARNSDVFYKVDFIERESPVVLEALELLEGEEIDSLKVFRESSAGAQKALQPVKRAGVKGGDVLDKMVHEVYVLDFVEAAGGVAELELKDARSDYFMPKSPGSERFMSLDGGVSKELGPGTATAQTKAVFDSSGTRVELHSGWLGLSGEARDATERIQEQVGEDVTETGYTQAGESAFLDEEARFFIVEGSRTLAGDMLHKRLYDLETGEELETPGLMHDQLYRVIEKAVLAATGEEEVEVDGKETDIFMNGIFDVRDRALENVGGYLEELEKANSRLHEMIVDDVEVEEEEVKA